MSVRSTQISSGFGLPLRHHSVGPNRPTIGAPAAKGRSRVNRADSSGWAAPEYLHRALGRGREHRVVSDGPLVVRSNNEGVPFVLANPSAPVSQDITRIANELLGAARLPVAAGRQ